MATLYRDKQTARIMERAEKVFSLRLAGFSYRKIADQLDISIDTVREDVKRITVEFPEQTARDLVAFQNLQLVEMMRPHYLKAIKGDSRSTGAMLKLMEHQAKLFSLFDIPQDNGMADAMSALNALAQSVKEQATQGG